MDRLDLLREQMASDFQVTWKIMGSTASRVEEHALALEEISRRVVVLSRETAEGLRQVEGRMRLMEQRFGVFLDAVQNEVHGTMRAELADLRSRVERLEKGSPPAA